MLSGILSLIGVGVLVYIFIKLRKMENESKKRFKELKIIYKIGTKKYKELKGEKIHKMTTRQPIESKGRLKQIEEERKEARKNFKELKDYEKNRNSKKD
jgi:hypothetical protein